MPVIVAPLALAVPPSRAPMVVTPLPLPVQLPHSMVVVLLSKQSPSLPLARAVVLVPLKYNRSPLVAKPLRALMAACWVDAPVPPLAIGTWLVRVMLPAALKAMLPDALTATVPEASGKVMVRLLVGVVTVMLVVKPESVTLRPWAVLELWAKGTLVIFMRGDISPSQLAVPPLPPMFMLSHSS